MGCPRLEENSSIKGWKPIYQKEIILEKIENRSAEPTLIAGKIVANGDLVFQNDVNRGIHVIDVSDKKLPKKMTFIAINGCTDYTIKENTLYANRYAHLEIINIENILAVQSIATKENFLSIPQNQPPDATNWYECPSVQKGYIVGWEWDEKTMKYCR